MNNINTLYKAFEAYPSDATFKAYIEAIHMHFGDKAIDVINMLSNHPSGNLCDFICSVV